MDTFTTSLNKTQLCGLFLQGKCRRDVCHFAHSLQEISVPACISDYDCRNFERFCDFFHPSLETIQDYYYRVHARDNVDNYYRLLYKNIKEKGLTKHLVNAMMDIDVKKHMKAGRLTRSVVSNLVSRRPDLMAFYMESDIKFAPEKERILEDFEVEDIILSF
jgi:hypothetical protein